MKNKKYMINMAFYLSGIIVATLFFIQIRYMSSFADEIHNKHEQTSGKDKFQHKAEEQTESAIRDTNRLWCKEHSVYEDECFICHPELASKNREVISDSIYCEEHMVQEQECGICHPELAALLEPGKGLKVRLKSPESAAKAGVVTAVPDNDEPSAGHVVLCQASYNLNHLARITPLTSGVIRRVMVDVGAYVSKDDVLVEIISPEIADAKADYLTSLTNETLKELVYKREKGLFEKKISSQREYQQAQAEYQMTINTTKTGRQKLLNYGFTEAEVQEIVEAKSSSSTLHIRAPFSGTIIERNAVVGEATGQGDTLFSLADLSTMWLELSIPEDRLSFFKVGNLIEASFNSLPEKKLNGELVWLSSNIEETSRMLKARAIVKNPDSQLKHGMFGQVLLLPEQSNKALYVPADSIQRFNKKSFVFVKLSDDIYEIRSISLGSRNNKNVEVLEGVSPHDEIVTAGSFILKSEFLISLLGKGCVDE